MQQFDTQFINYHLMPLIEEMLTDVVLRKKQYLDKLFLVDGDVRTVLSELEKQDLFAHYFNIDHKNSGVPFSGAEEKQDQKRFLDFLVDYMSLRAPRREDRIRAFLPVVDQTAGNESGQVVWPAEVKRNLFLASYHIAQNFEKVKLTELIETDKVLGKIEQAKRDSELLEQGMLMLTQDQATGEWTGRLRAPDLRADDTAVEFAPSAPEEMEKLMQGGLSIPSPQTLHSIAQGGKSPQTVARPSTYQKNVPGAKNPVSSNGSLTQSFQKKRGNAIINKLQKNGFQILENVHFDATGHAIVKVRSGVDTLLVSVDPRIPFGQNLKFQFTFQGGPASGKSFTIDEDKLSEAFHTTSAAWLASDARTLADSGMSTPGMRTARELYEDVDLRQKLGVKGDAVPERAHRAANRDPRTGLPSNQKQNLWGANALAPAEGLPDDRNFANQTSFSLPKNVRERTRSPLPMSGRIRQRRTGKQPPRGSIRDLKRRQLESSEDAVEAEESPMQTTASFSPPSPAMAGSATRKNKKKGGGGVVGAIVGAHVAGIGSAIWGGFSLGSSGSSTSPDAAAPAFAFVKTVMIAIHNYLPNLFG